jgi:hypothetical protein
LSGDERWQDGQNSPKQKKHRLHRHQLVVKTTQVPAHLRHSESVEVGHGLVRVVLN